MNQTTDATSIFSPLWRYKWLILAVGIVVGAGSYFYYKRETPVYRAATQVYLVPEEQAAEKATNAKALSAAISDQVAIINAIVVERVRHQLRREHKGALVRGGKVKASAQEKSLFITVTTEGHSAEAAALLANATAQAYIKRQSAAHQRSVERAISISRRQLLRIEVASQRPAPKSTSGGKGSTSTSSSPSSSTANVLQEASLNSKINQLEASLYVNGAQQIKPATPATARLLAPTPKRNAIFGFVIGLVLAAIAAYAMARLDRRPALASRRREDLRLAAASRTAEGEAPDCAPGGTACAVEVSARAAEAPARRRCASGQSRAGGTESLARDPLHQRECRGRQVHDRRRSRAGGSAKRDSGLPSWRPTFAGR